MRRAVADPRADDFASVLVGHGRLRRLESVHVSSRVRTGAHTRMEAGRGVPYPKWRARLAANPAPCPVVAAGDFRRPSHGGFRRGVTLPSRARRSFAPLDHQAATSPATT